MTYQDTPLAEITVPENRLRELQDYSGLAASMDEVGLLQPITVTDSGTLVAGRHRVEAARSLGWESIAAFVVEEDSLTNRLAEIDENLRRLDLTVYEQSKHAEERERVLEAMGQRNKVGGDRRSEESFAHGERMKSTNDIADEAGMSEASWKRRTKIGRSLGDKTRATLDNADPTEDKHRAFLNSTSQLDHLANISEKRGDDQAADTAERVLNGEYKSTFDAYPETKEEAKEAEPNPVAKPEPLKGEDRRPAKEAIQEDVDLPSWGEPPERTAYYNVLKRLRELTEIDPAAVAANCKTDYDVDVKREHVEGIQDWLERFDAALQKRRDELKPGYLRVVNVI